jgi:hypothetical protein
VQILDLLLKATNGLLLPVRDLNTLVEQLLEPILQAIRPPRSLAALDRSLTAMMVEA